MPACCAHLAPLLTPPRLSPPLCPTPLAQPSVECAQQAARAEGGAVVALLQREFVRKSALLLDDATFIGEVGAGCWLLGAGCWVELEGLALALPMHARVGTAHHLFAPPHFAAVAAESRPRSVAVHHAPGIRCRLPLNQSLPCCPPPTRPLLFLPLLLLSQVRSGQADAPGMDCAAELARLELRYKAWKAEFKARLLSTQKGVEAVSGGE